MSDSALIVDIGSNTIRAMRASFAHSAFSFGSKRVMTTRLASGMDTDGFLSRRSMVRSLLVLETLHEEADGLPILAYATSAVRDAANRDEFLAWARQSLGAEIAVLSGEEEGAYAFLGATGGTGALIDVGGGSFQIITETAQASFPGGCVRALDHCTAGGSPAETLEQLTPWLISLGALPAVDTAHVTGVGGTILTLAALSLGQTRYDAKGVDGAPITADGLRSLLDRLYAMGDARRTHPLLTERHDVILPGGAILAYLLHALRIPVLHASDADGMEGFARRRLAEGGASHPAP